MDGRRGNGPSRPHDSGIPLTQQVADVAPWGSPRGVEGGHSSGNPDRAEDHKSRLEDQVYLLVGAWTTPLAHDKGRTPRPERRRGGGGNRNLEDDVGLAVEGELLVMLAGWTTPQASEPLSGERPSRAATGRTTEYLSRQVRQVPGGVGWATPTARDHKGSRSHTKGGSSVATQVRLVPVAGYPTPVANDDNKSPDAHRAMKARMEGGTRKEITSLQVLAKEIGHFPTPTAERAADERQFARGNPNLATVASWASPIARDHKDGAMDLSNTPVNHQLGRQVLLSRVRTGDGGALASNFVRWLMGYPAVWQRTAPTSKRRSRSYLKSRSHSALEDSEATATR